jgi:hypothetical protein
MFQFTNSESEIKTIRLYSGRSLRLAFGFLLFMVLYAALAKFVSFTVIEIDPAVSEKILYGLNVAAVVITMAILVISKKMYYAKFLRKSFINLEQTLKQWFKLDLICFMLAEITAVFGVVLRMAGISFGQLFHFFVLGVILILIVLPMELRILQRIKHLSEISSFVAETQ